MIENTSILFRICISQLIFIQVIVTYLHVPGEFGSGRNGGNGGVGMEIPGVPGSIGIRGGGGLKTSGGEPPPPPEVGGEW